MCADAEGLLHFIFKKLIFTIDRKGIWSVKKLGVGLLVVMI